MSFANRLSSVRDSQAKSLPNHLLIARSYAHDAVNLRDIPDGI